MKAETAIITINEETTLKVLLVPETPKELAFLQDALDKCENYKVSFEDNDTLNCAS